MSLRSTIAAAVALLLAACGDGVAPPKAPAPSPLFYEIANAEGQREGWLLGTIHALPEHVAWRTPAIQTAIDEADLLVLEVAQLDDTERHAAVFASLAAAPPQPKLSAKVPAELRAQLRQVLEAVDRDEDEFATADTWAAALAMAGAGAVGDRAHGVDRAIAADFAGRRIEELEGLETQLAMFDRLPEQDQRDLLAAVVRAYPETRADPDRLVTMWLAGDAAAIEAEMMRGILADPELYETLLAARNRDWIGQILPMLGAAPRPLIAVGAAHLIGPDGLVAMLVARGYTVQRLG